MRRCGKGHFGGTDDTGPAGEGYALQITLEFVYCMRGTVLHHDGKYEKDPLATDDVEEGREINRGPGDNRLQTDYAPYTRPSGLPPDKCTHV